MPKSLSLVIIKPPEESNAGFTGFSTKNSSWWEFGQKIDLRILCLDIREQEEEERI